MIGKLSEEAKGKSGKTGEAPMIDQEIKGARVAHHPAGTVAGRAPVAAPSDLAEKHTGSCGADTDREQLKGRKGS